MSLTVPFKHSKLATMAGTAARPNEDYAAAGPDWALVLDGATHFDGVDTGCIHDVPWLVGHLAAALVEQLILGPPNLPETLASAIEATCSAHANTCDLANPDSPSSTVALVRAVGTAIEYLVLGDSPVILRTSDGITPVVDDRVDHLQPGGRPYTRDLVRSKRNASGGFWVASTNPQAAHEAISGVANDVTHVTLLTDGITRLVEYYGYSWTDIFELLSKDGPSGLIQRVREAEHASPPPTYGYGKQHDDATAVYIQVI
jgi:Protein phosphatase 2C